MAKIKNPLIIVVGPSGAGKSSLVEKAVNEMSQLVDLITYTTRKPRKGESEGNPYHFVSLEEFRHLEADNFFIETAEVHGNFYGSPRDQLERAWEKGKAIIMDVDVQGADSYISQYPQTYTIFVMPPSIDVLRQRIAKRDGGSPHDLELRMQNATREIAQAHRFSCQLVNEDFAKSYAQFKKIIEDHLKSL